MKEQTKPDIYPVEISIVIPCLNEADTLETCIRKAQEALESNSISGEIIVADNGSVDQSCEIARKMDVRIVPVGEKGYGHALMGGIGAAEGKFILMGDADDSYDFLEIPRFVESLRLGADLVQGCRLPSGGGQIMAGAMPWTHRWIGNPGLSFLVRWWFKTDIKDVYCGMRGFTKSFYEQIGLRCTGMEFATEMIIKASLQRSRIVQVPITLHPDGRKSHPPHLKTFRDGWRTLRLFLMYCPRWLYLFPGLLLSGLGVLLFLVGFFEFSLSMPTNSITLGAHTMEFGSLLLLCGYQTILFAIFTKTFAISEGLIPRDSRLDHFYRLFDLERGLIIALFAAIAGMALWISTLYGWYKVDFGPLNYGRTMRLAITGSLFLFFSFQTVCAAFFVSILGMKRR